MRKCLPLFLVMMIFGTASTSLAQTLLTYDNFLYLNKEHQREYVQTLQKFAVELEKKGVGPQGFSDNYSSLQKWAFLMNFIEEAQADTQYLGSDTSIAVDNPNAKACKPLGCSQNADGSWSPNVMKTSSPVTSEPAASPSTPPATPAKTPLVVDGVKPKFRCIYAGFTILSAKCVPFTNFTFHNKDGNATVYTCVSNPTKPDGDPKIISADPINPKKSVLCNPALFGTIKSKPICIAPGKNATKDCKAASDADPASLDGAVAVLTAAPMYYGLMTKTINIACSDDPAATEKLNLSAKSLADVKQTCVTYKEQFAVLSGKYNAATPATTQQTHQ